MNEDTSTLCSPFLSIANYDDNNLDPQILLFLNKAKDLLVNRQVVSVPTETVYGLAANAFDDVAVSRIFQAKCRPQDNPLIVHISDLKMFKSLFNDESIADSILAGPYAEPIRRYWPGPLTIIVPRSESVSDGVTAGLDTMAIRMPSHPVVRRLIHECGFPIAAPSANSSGRPSPTLASHVMDDLGGRIPMIIDGGPCLGGVESTVLDALRNPPVILRPGGVTWEELCRLPSLKGLQVYKRDFSDAKLEQNPTTPGMKYRHYSPTAPVLLLDLKYFNESASHSTTFGNRSDASSSKDSTYADNNSIANGYRSNLENQVNVSKKCSGNNDDINRISNARLCMIKARNRVVTERLKLIKESLNYSKNSTQDSNLNMNILAVLSVTEPEIPQGLRDNGGDIRWFYLGDLEDSDEVARTLFAALREADHFKVKEIIVEGILDTNAGLAVMNRVTK
eukprot:CAMPEP_0175078646 /NCGR_PEP_ID=MMETSP0052_2-20121109/24270_1 /TAXON_ID=51329 ORGANISM="Polytomella parva, Strain SAG 63-3" /NCGR_SAMPLE_ID=MMETSP0052_2 /ASSEMBLY_ACC=CAM_ASM_000194 /LENGTH=450 /DNA_ID=CAMNT_0016348663 /DNA_START=76 /DNA_END=1425 /DNA_ORIENTATION=+